jgi:hypothetical protein
VPVFVVIWFITFVTIITTSQESFHAVDDIEKVSVFVEINFGFSFFSRIDNGIENLM